MIKFILFCLLFVSVSASSQEKFTKYYDSAWAPASKENAFYYTEFIKNDSLYNCSSYWVKSNRLNCTSVFADTLFTQPRGHLLRYYESGRLEDSAYFHETGELKEIYHYYPSGQLWAHYAYDKRSKRTISEGFDQQGKAIKDFTYLKEAEFPGGEGEWKLFLSQNLKSTVPVKNKAPVGTYQVIVQFVINENGRIVDVKPLTNFGYGMEEEAARVIRKGPRWMPLILLGEARSAYRRQPITFLVENEK
jgi:hypothetical protein